uniref:Histone deacetylase 14 n=1 Tax=Tanacetum cinerariifolium TaxID=118510 RepID=A0A6L2KMV1_TANCI|nr:histone deacetylase 14 [Tanacetum cinerariifolium]
MADENVPAPIRSDDQKLLFAAWAFTASASVLAIYIQQFWNTLTYEAKTGAYSFQLDENRDAIMEFVNQLGYTECLTSKTSGHDRPRYPSLQMLWGIIMSTNVDYAKLLWEEFVQAIQTFLTNKENLGSPTKKGRKDKPNVIPYCWFTKLIIYHLGIIYDIHQRSTSPFQLLEEDLRLGNLKFIPKGEVDEVFGMPIPNELISNNIRNAQYYYAYLEMVAKHDRKILAEKEGKMKTASAKQPKSKPAIEKSSKLAPAPKPKATKERPSKASTAKPPKPKPAKENSTKTTPPQQAGKTSAIKALSAGPSTQAQDDTSAHIIRDSSFPADAETGAASEKTNSGGDTEILQTNEEQGNNVDKQVNLKEKINKLDQGQAGSDPGRTLESRPPPEPVVIDKYQLDQTLEKVVGLLLDQTLNPRTTSLWLICTLRGCHVALQAPLQDCFRELLKADMKEILHQRMFKTDTYKSLPNIVTLYEALEASMELVNRDKHLTEMDKSSKQKSGPHTKQPVVDIPMPDTANISDSEDTDSAHLPKNKQRLEWLKPISDDERPVTLKPALVIPTSHIPDAVNNWAKDLATTYQDLIGKTGLTQADFEGQAYEVVKAFYPDIIHLQFQMEECHKMLTYQIDWANPEGDQVRIDISKPLPLSGPPDHVTIQTQFFFNHELDYLRYGSKGSGQALLISKIKAARYLDFGLKLLVLEQIWTNEVCTYDICASYGISHWWFNHQKFYIDRHITDSSRKIFRTHMRILSVVSTKAYSRYGCDYLKEITLRRADYQEYTIAKKDFKNLYPSDFEELNLLLLQTRSIVIRQRVEDFQLGIESYHKQLNLTKQGWDTKGFEYKHNYIIIDSPCAVMFPVDNNERKIMRFNKIYKFSDGMLTNIMEALDYKVKEYKNIREIPTYHSEDGNPARANIKQALGSNFLIHSYHAVCFETFRLREQASKVQVKMEMKIPRSSGVYFITACSYSTDTSKELMKAQVYASKLPQL